MIWIILLGGMVQGAFAQNLEIKGMVRDAVSYTHLTLPTIA